MDKNPLWAGTIFRAFLLLAAALFITGCKSLPRFPFAASGPAESVASDAASGADDHEQPAAHHGAAANTVEPLDLTLLESDAWFEEVEPPFARRSTSYRRWHHHQIDPLLGRPASNRVDLSSALASSHAIVAANAAILSAHWESAHAAAELVEVARSPKLRIGLRAAAIEALGAMTHDLPGDKLRGLLQQLAPLKAARDLNGQAEQPIGDLHAELIRGLARHAEPGDEAWFTAAVRSKIWKVRFEGITAWTQVRDEDLPMAAIDLRSDQDPRIRAAALRAIAAHRDGNALEYLQQGVNDRSLEVHTAAIAALGQLGSDEARIALTKLKGHRAELSRAAAVAALAAMGLRDEVEAAVKDTSQHVRLAVAESLAGAVQEGKQVAAETVATASQLARDASSEVQRQAVESLGDWPLAQAGPVLILAIAEGDYAGRKAAAEQLARRWPPAADFPVEAAAERRETALAELKKLWIKEFGELSGAVVAAEAEAQRAVTLSEDRIRDIQALVTKLQQADLTEAARREAVTALQHVGPQLVAVLEQKLDSTGALPAAFYDEVLPGVSPAFALLARLTSRELMERRAAAAELVTQTATVALPSLAVERLAQLVEAEKDPVVWRSALAAVAENRTDMAMRMAYTAIGNASAEVRRKACEYLGRHGDPRHAGVLLPALGDSDATVVLAAARALGAVGTLDDPAPLVRLLNVPDRQLRMEASLALARLRFEQGVAGLERLALDTDMQIRLQTAKAMGEIADPVFLPTLVHMLSDKPDVQRVAMESLAVVAGANPTAGKDSANLSNEEKVRRWQLWYRERQDGPSPTASR